MKIFYIILVLLFTNLFADGHGKVDTYSCEETQEAAWSDNSVYKDSYYQGTITSQYKVSALNGGGFAQLKEFYKNWCLEQSEDKKITEVENYFDILKNGKETKLNAIKINYTNTDVDDSGTIVMNLDSYIGHDPGNVFVIQSISQKVIKATDDRQRLQLFKSYVRINKSSEPGYYDVYTWRFYRLEGYWYEPKSLFY